MSLEIRNEYTNLEGKKYPGIRNIHFGTKEDLKGNVGKYICETKNEKNIFFSSDKEIEEDGVYIYQTYYNLKKALRIYKDWAQYKYTSHGTDVKLIYELLLRQPYIELTDFPTGVVTIENYVIGQEITLYKNFKTLLEIAKIKSKKDIIKYYLDMIKILEELYNADIIYKDCHSKNFLINENTNEVKLIDFEYGKVDLKKSLYSYRKMIECLKENINRINIISNINFSVQKEETLEDIRETILSKKYKNE